MKDREARERIQHLENLEEINDQFLTEWPKIVSRGLDFLTQRVAELEAAVPPGEYHGDDELPAPGGVPERAEALATAITDERAVMFRYTKPDEIDWELRQLSPYEIIKAQNGIVVRGWDHDREEIRSFRLDRMEALTRCDLFVGTDGEPSYPVLRYRKPQISS